MGEIRPSAEREPVSFERRARVRRGLGRVMAAAKALGAGEIEAARQEIAEARTLDVFSSEVMAALAQIGESLQQGQTRRAAAQLQTVAEAMREELSRYAAAAPGDAKPRPTVPTADERPATVPPLDPETAPPIATAPPQSFVPDAARALALAQLIGKAEPPRTKRVAAPPRAAYVIAAGIVGAVLLFRVTDWRTFFVAPQQPRAVVTQPATTRTSGDAPASTPARTPTRETDVPIALPTRGTLPLPKQRDDIASRASDVTDAAGTERRVVAPRSQPVPNVERPAAPLPSPEPPAAPRTPVEELPIVPARIEPPSTAPADASGSPTAASEADQIQRTLGQYREAYERLDVRGARAVWPGVNERALARAFAGLESQGLVFDRCDVNVGDDSATAVCNGTARYVPKVGSKEPQVEPRRWTFSLRKSANGWEIENVETGR